MRGLAPILCASLVFSVPVQSLAQATPERLSEFYSLLFAQGCKKHPEFIPGRNKHWLREANFEESEFAALIAQLAEADALVFEDGFIVGQLGECG